MIITLVLEMKEQAFWCHRDY